MKDNEQELKEEDKMRNQQRIFVIVPIILLMTWAAYLFSQEEKIEKNRLEVGIDLYTAGQYAQAIEAFSEIIKLSTNTQENVEAYIWLGYTCWTTDKKEDARSSIEKAVQLKPDMKLASDVRGSQAFPREFADDVTRWKDSIVGIAFIKSTPDKAVVYIDSKKIGMTPLKIELLYQKYEVRVIKPGYSPVIKDLELKRDNPNLMTVDLLQGKHWKGFVQSAAAMVVLTLLLNAI
jgi:tetratricopeptide (TPR) repeat protein